MAQNKYQQQSVQRKFLYFGLILALFTASLLFRKGEVQAFGNTYSGINKQAENLRLREVDQGEPELTASAMYLTLSGLRGVVVTSLWLKAIEKQRKHEWNELESAVRSLTKLQPHFISPWLFQSWNLAFNVSVECDKAKDKYYFITRGIELLAEGERRNRGNEHPDANLRSPANPEMRYNIGFTYQLKISQSDDQNVMQCLLDMSAMDPADRHPSNLWAAGASGKKVNRAAFLAFCNKHPRFVRRLQDKLKYSSATSVVTFLEENRDIPSRFQKLTDPGQAVPLLPPTEQFPVVPPPHKNPSWPDPESRNFGGRDVDVYQIVRAWAGYALEPLPPPNPDPVFDSPQFDPLRYRLPRMAVSIFRGQPARAQAYYAEHLQDEGWFDGEGWSLQKFFASEAEEEGFAPVAFAGTKKYYSGAEWEQAYQEYLEYGIQNGLYLDPQQLQALEDEKNLKGPKSFAARKLAGWEHYRQMTNYYAFLDQSKVERLQETVLARRALYQARKAAANIVNTRTLRAYQDALYGWLDILIKHPVYRQTGTIPEDSYELQLKYLRLSQDYHSSWLKPLMIDAARLTPPMPGDVLRNKDIDVLGVILRQKNINNLSVVPIFSARGPLDVYLYSGPNEQKIQASLLAVAETAVWPHGWISKTMPPRDQRRIMALSTMAGDSPGSQWSRLVTDAVIFQVRDRLGIGRQQQPQPKQGPQ